MDVEPKRAVNWPHWPDQGNGRTRRDRLERRLFRDSERDAELEQAHAAIREIERVAAAKAAELERLELAVDRLEADPVPVSDPAPGLPLVASASYLVFVCTHRGYALEEAPGEPPAPGDRIAIGGVEHVVSRLGRSPLPGDARSCAYLEPS